MVERKSPSYMVFLVFNYVFLAFLAFTCLFPVVNVIAVSFSNPAAVAANRVTLWPVDTQVTAYQEIFGNRLLLRSIWVSVRRVLIGTAINLFLITATAYPLSKERSEFPARNIIMWYFVIPMLFNGGLIPTYLLIRNVGLLNSFWVLVIPAAVPIFSVIIMMNFLRSLPRSLFEVAMIDGANHWYILYRIAIPLSMPAIATLTLFAMVGHWNSWFDGLIYMLDSKKWPLQTFLQSAIKAQNELEKIAELGEFEKVRRLSNQTLMASKIVVATVPIVCVYPFLQKYFIKGILLGSIKE